MPCCFHNFIKSKKGKSSNYDICACNSLCVKLLTLPAVMETVCSDRRQGGFSLCITRAAYLGIIRLTLSVSLPRVSKQWKAPKVFVSVFLCSVQPLTKLSTDQWLQFVLSFLFFDYFFPFPFWIFMKFSAVSSKQASPWHAAANRLISRSEDRIPFVPKINKYIWK